MDTITGHAPDLTVPGLCHHLPIEPSVTDWLDLRSGPYGPEAHGDLIIGFTQTGQAIKLSGGPEAAEMFEQIAIHAAQVAAWIRGRRAA